MVLVKTLLLKLVSEEFFLSTLLPFSLIVSNCAIIAWQAFNCKQLPYGKYALDLRSAEGIDKISLPGRFLFFLVPTTILSISIAVLVQTKPLPPVENIVLMSMFIGHYIQRGLIYPFFIFASKQVPLFDTLMGVLSVLLLVNGYIQPFFHLKYATYPAGYIWSARGATGVLVFMLGIAINLHSDHILRKLRAANTGGGYAIPRGGLFEYVSAANYFGEILEWFGYGIYAASLAGWACFAISAGNLLPRALSYHRWYLQKFEDYPKERRAIIPFIL